MVQAGQPSLEARERDIMAEKKAKCDNCGHTVNVVNDHAGFGTLRRLDSTMKCCPKPFYIWGCP